MAASQADPPSSSGSIPEFVAGQCLDRALGLLMSLVARLRAEVSSMPRAGRSAHQFLNLFSRRCGDFIHFGIDLFLVKLA